jgi:hypothetical protein
MSVECWKKIEGFDGYEVSSEGRVRSLDRLVECLDNSGKLIKKRLAGRIRVLSKTQDGYLRVSLYDMLSKKNTSCRVHRLVANAFISKINDKPEVDHINTDKLDNRMSNLRWADDYDQQSNNNHRRLGITGLRHIYKRSEDIYRVVIERKGNIIRSGNLSLEDAISYRDSILQSYTSE